MACACTRSSERRFTLLHGIGPGRCGWALITRRRSIEPAEYPTRSVRRASGFLQTPQCFPSNYQAARAGSRRLRPPRRESDAHPANAFASNRWFTAKCGTYSSIASTSGRIILDGVRAAGAPVGTINHPTRAGDRSPADRHRARGPHRIRRRCRSLPICARPTVQSPRNRRAAASRRRRDAARSPARETIRGRLRTPRSAVTKRCRRWTARGRGSPPRSTR
jgi:hypothetical protein